MLQLAYPAANAKAGNAYGAVPPSKWKDASIVLMVIHQCVAYALYVTPVFFMWEKFCVSPFLQHVQTGDVILPIIQSAE